MDYDELKWYIEPHRWYGIIIFGGLLSFILWLLLGSQGRLKINSWVKDGVNGVKVFVNRITHRNYIRVDDLETNIELEEMPELTKTSDELH